MSLQDKIEYAQNNVADLEQLYRQAEADGETHVFKEAIAQGIAKEPQHTLFLAWAYRLNLLPENTDVHSAQRTHWQKAIGISLVLGCLFLLLSGNQPPVPFPNPQNPYFWLGWSPILALAVLTFLSPLNRANVPQYGIWGMVVVGIGALTALVFWHQTGAIAVLAALHLPFVLWATVGASVVKQHNHPATQFHAFSVKSVETVLTGGIYFGAFMIFLMLTYGIFSALNIKIADSNMQKAVAWGLGAISLLSLASVYNPSCSPTAQNWTSGLTRLLGILTRLLLPLTLGVLAIYTFYFIPVYFWRPFEERDVLIVYNATIIAILVLIALSVAYTDGQTLRQQTLLRYALHVLGFLTGLLNLYALVAIVYRINTYDLTPNRYAVLGWNVITLIILVVIGVTLWRAQPHTWAIKLRESLARMSIFTVVWALWVLFILPLSFH
jgi:hypothetical protein